MFLIESIRKNVWLMTYHFNVWILKISIVFFAITPIFNDQSCVSYISGLVLNSDTRGIVDIFYSSNVEFPVLLGVVLGILIIFLFFMETLFEAGFINTYIKQQKKYFWDSIISFGKKLFKINGLCVVPNIAFLSMLVIVYDTFRVENSVVVSFMYYCIIFSLLFYLLKILDSIKFNYVIKNRTLKNSFKEGFKLSSFGGKKSWLLNMSYGTSLTLFLYIVSFVNQFISINSTELIIVMFVSQQLIVLLRQVFRYIYLGAVISIETEKENQVTALYQLQMNSYRG